MDELKPCPFCGNNEMNLLEVGAIDHGDEKRPFGFRFTGYVTCLSCFAKATGTSFHWDEDSAKLAAIRAWNRRIENEALREGKWISDGDGYHWVYVCSVCGWKDGYPFNERHKFCPNCGADMRETKDE